MRDYFDKYREVYPKMSFEQVLRWNSDIVMPQNICFRSDIILEHFKGIVESDDVIVELGSQYGELAKLVLENIDVRKWYGYDVDERIVEKNKCEDGRYIPVVLKDWFHNTDLPEFNVFVSTHTIEHLSVEQVYSTLDSIRNCDKVILDIPLGECKQSWNRNRSTHVLEDIGYSQIKDKLESYGFKLVRQDRFGGPVKNYRNWETSWKK